MDEKGAPGQAQIQKERKQGHIAWEECREIVQAP